VTSNYDLKPLTQVCEVLSGGTPKTTVPAFWNGNIPWASVKDFNIDSRWFSKTEKSISQLGLESCSSVLLEPGDLVISARGTVGAVGQCKMRTSFNQSNYGLRAKSGLSKNDYLYYALGYAKRALIGDTHGGMFDTITRDTLDRLLIPVPTLKVQEQIAEILGSLDMKIAVNNALSKTLEDIAQTIFKSWFIDFDPVKAKMVGEKPAGMDDTTAALFPDSMEESELGLIPKGWGIRPIGDSVVKQKVGKLFDSKTSFPSGSVPVLDQGKSGVVGFHNEKPGIFASPEMPLVVFANHTCSLRLVSYPFSVIQNVFPLMGNKVDVIWLYFAVEGKQQFDSYKGHWPDFVLHKIIQPTEEATRAFRKLVEPLLKEKWLLEQQSKILGNIRDSLLPRLISGELQIPEEMLAS
jgi:type I restriction enzyme S subunit